VFILLTAIFVFVIIYKGNKSRTNRYSNENFDGNGEFHYRGRGCKRENVETLLRRIDWLAKNSINDSLYTTSYLIAFIITLGFFFIVYAFYNLILSPWIIITSLFVSFVVCFSVMNLFDFHTNRYRNYYIRKNLDYIYKKLKINRKDPPLPSSKSKMPFRTKVQDVLYR
jgi:hypothetical protein